MNKLLTTLGIGFSMLCIPKAFGSNFSSALNLRLFDNGIFSVVLDEKPSYQPSGFFSDKNLKPGYHKLKVIRFVGNKYGHYPLKEVVYKGWINIPANSVIFANIDCHNQLDIVKIEPKCGPPHGHGHGHGYGGGYEGDWEDDEYGYEGGNGWAPAPPPMPACISAVNFAQLKASMANKNFDSSRMEIASQALNYSFFTADQVAEIMRMFSFESSRLEFAKMAFSKTIDKQNYFVVNNAFTFDSSIGELNQYLAMHR